MRKMKILGLVLLCFINQACYNKVEKEKYREGDLRYLVDSSSSNRRLAKKMPELNRLKYIYIFEYSHHQAIAILLDIYNNTLYIRNSYYVLQHRNKDLGIILSDEATRRFINTITDYDLQRWRNHWELIWSFSSSWDISLEFEDMIIYHYDMKRPDNYYEFLLKWYQLIDECSPGIFDDGPYNTQIYDSYKKKLEQKNKVNESQE